VGAGIDEEVRTHLFNDRARSRPQWNTLAATKRFQFHFTLGHELARTFDEVPELARFNHAAYERWREKRKLAGNLSNRLRYASGVETAGKSS
jgi:hypothetical protein